MSGKSAREMLAASGVIASMVFVGMELRQNNTLAEAAAYQQLSLATSSNWIAVAHNPQLNTLLWDSRRAGNDSTWWGSLEQSEIDQLASIQVGTYRAYEAVYTQVRLGLLDEEALESMGWSTTLDAGQHFLWPMIRSSMDDYFIEYLEAGWARSR